MRLEKALAMSQAGSDIEASSCSKMPELETQIDVEKEAQDDGRTWDWDKDPENPYNWSARLKVQQVLMIASAAFTT